MMKPADRGSVEHFGRAAIVLVLGLGVGALTSVLQQYLNQPWLSLVNAASPWLTPMFAMGALWRRPVVAAVAGLATGLLELVGYYATASARGYTAGHAIVLFWTACAVIGGPAFGLAGWAWWRQHHRWRGLAAAALPAAFFAEAIVVYGFRLHYGSTAVLFAVLGVIAAALLGLRGRQHLRLLAWLCVTLPAGVIAELILNQIYDQSIG
ncbi:MAG: hypothetical protein JWN96_1127 [Mycobacterium sp.]|nr:hypothetical protein [Mycobacterium sp.]